MSTHLTLCMSTVHHQRRETETETPESIKWTVEVFMLRRSSSLSVAVLGVRLPMTDTDTDTDTDTVRCCTQRQSASASERTFVCRHFLHLFVYMAAYPEMWWCAVLRISPFRMLSVYLSSMSRDVNRLTHTNIHSNPLTPWSLFISAVVHKQQRTVVSLAGPLFLRLSLSRGWQTAGAAVAAKRKLLCTTIMRQDAWPINHWFRWWFSGGPIAHHISSAE